MLKDEIIAKLDTSKALCTGPPPGEKSLSDREISDSLESFSTMTEKTLIIVNDHFRSTPSHKIIELLRKTEKIKAQLTFLVATGSHEPPTKDIAIQLTGATKEDEILYHNVNSTNEYSFGGTTSRGTKVLFNSIVNKFDKIMTIGGVEPHYFAGFTGGAKSLIPGIAALETISQNHKWAMNPAAKIIQTEGNPVFEDIWEASNLVKPLDTIQSIQLVNHGKTIFSISHGTLESAFGEAKSNSQEIYCTPVKNKFDRIISFAQAPLDKNLYQAQKAIENTKNVLKDGGSLVVVAECRKGLGSAFLEKLSSSSPEQILKTISFENYEFGDHKIYRFASVAQKAQLLYVGNLPESHFPNDYMKKITINQLTNLYNEWLKNNDNILIDKAGGFMTYYLN